MIQLFIGAWLALSPVQGQSDTTTVVLVEWWHTADVNYTFDKDLYTITDSVRNYTIYNIVKIDSMYDTSHQWEVPKNTYLYGLICERIPPKTMMWCIVPGYDPEYFYHYGFVPNIYPSPEPEIRK